MAKQKYTESVDLNVEVPHSESFDMVVEQLVHDVEQVPMATLVSEKEVVDAALFAFGKTLKGEPELFDREYFEILGKLVTKGIAADFGDGLYGRGFAWHSTYGG